MAGSWVLGKRRGLLTVDHGRLVERVLPVEHTLGLVRIDLADPFLSAVVVAESDMSPPSGTDGLGG